MKRKAFARALAVALCLMLCVPALATSWVQPGQTASDVAAPALYAGDEAVLAGASGGIGAYVDGQGGLYLTGYDGTMSLQYAAQIIHVDEEEVLYLAGEEMEDLGGTLMRLNLSDLSETALADNVLRACAVTGDTVYYVSALAPMALMRLEIDAGATTQATATQVATAEANIVALHMLPEGLVAELEAGQGALLYNHRAGAFAEYTGELPASALYVDGAFLRLSAEGMLSMQALDTGNVEFIDFGVQDFAVLDGNIYYISTAAGQKRLKAFDPAQMSWRMLASLDLGVTQAAASAENLFLLNGSTGEAYRVDVGTGALAAFNSCDVAALAEDGYTLDSLRMEAMSGQVNLYAIFAPEDLEAEGWAKAAYPHSTLATMPPKRRGRKRRTSPRWWPCGWSMARTRPRTCSSPRRNTARSRAAAVATRCAPCSSGSSGWATWTTMPMASLAPTRSMPCASCRRIGQPWLCGQRCGFGGAAGCALQRGPACL